MCALQEGEACLVTPIRCWPGLRAPLIWLGEAPGCTPSSEMGLCGLGLLSDNLKKILGWARGAALWRPSHPRKPDLAPGPLVCRPGSAQGPTPLPRSVGGSGGKRDAGNLLAGEWAGDLDGCGSEMEGVGLAVSLRRPSPGTPPAPGPYLSWDPIGAQQVLPHQPRFLTGPGRRNGDSPQRLGRKSEGGGWGYWSGFSLLGTSPPEASSHAGAR